VTIASSGSDQEAILKDYQPDLILSNIAMLSIYGYNRMRKIRAMPLQDGGTILTIALTAYAH
jgi:CheY-like chemotaxis protein